MARLVLALALGLCLLEICEAQISLNISCRHRGVFHVERNGRYNLYREEAVELCTDLGTSLANMTQMQNALVAGFETCRYGWIEGHIAIPRIHQNPICAASNIGIYILVSNITDKYDVYCFNASETREKVCEQVFLPEKYIYHVPVPSDFPSLQDPQDPDEADPTQKQPSGEDGSEDVTYHNQPKGSSDQREDDVTDAPQHGDSRPKGHPHGSSAHGANGDATDAPITQHSPHGHHPGGFYDPWADDETDAPVTDPADHGHHPGGSSDPWADDATDAPDSEPEHHGHHPDGSSDHWADDATDAPETDPVDHGHHPGGSSDHWADDATDAPVNDPKDHGNHPGGSSDHWADDATDAPVTDPAHHGHHPGGSSDHGAQPGGSHQSASDTLTKATFEPGSYTDSDTDIFGGPYHSGSATTAGMLNPGGSNFGTYTDYIPVTDSSNADGSPYVDEPDKTNSEDSDLSNSVDSNAVTDKSHAGGPHQTKSDAWKPGDKDNSHSDNRVTYTDSMPDAHDGDGNAGNNEVDRTTDGGYGGGAPGGSGGSVRRAGGELNEVNGGDGSAEGLETPPGFKRHARVPDWLIIVVSLVSLALILAVCIAVNSRQTCGHKKKLVINGSTMEEGHTGDMNGDASKSQEMVNLVSREQQGDGADPQDKLMATDGAPNHPKGDTKIRV